MRRLRVTGALLGSSSRRLKLGLHPVRRVAAPLRHARRSSIKRELEQAFGAYAKSAFLRMALTTVKLVTGQR